MVTATSFSMFYSIVEQYAQAKQFNIVKDSRLKDTTTGVTKTQNATLKPTCSEHLQFIVQQANTYSVPLHPISCGKNWGYTDATPSCDNSVVVDLSSMNQILKIDQQHNFAIIEPGVTQQKLSDALAETELFMDCTGSSTGSSVVGNILERGFGHTAFGDRFSHSCSYEIVLGNGKFLRTGHLAYQYQDQHTANSCHTTRTAGPSVEGLFSQSNFGIVTKLCVWLQRKPEKSLPFVAIFATHDDFLDAIEPLVRLKEQGITTSTMHIGNKMRILSSSISWQGLDGLMPEETIENQLKQLGVGEWVMSGALYGSRSMVKLFKKQLKAQLTAQCNVKISFLEPSLLKRVSKVVNWLPKRSLLTLRTQLDTAQGLIDMHTGKPTDLFLRGCYHRHPSGYPESMDKNIDVAKDGCGVIWLSPTAAADRASVSELLNMLKSEFESQGFHLYATLSFVSARSVAIICNPIFDSTDLNQSKLAQQCTDATLIKCIENGYPPYRVSNVQWSSFYQLLSTEHKGLLNAIKSQLDPNNIISPGRYGIGQDP